MTGHITDFTAAGTLTGDELLEVSQLSTTVKITGTTLSALASDNSYNDSASGFLAAGFAVGMRVNVSGFTGNPANNLTVGIVTAVTAGKLTIGGTDGNVIVDDAAGESVTIAQWTTRRVTVDALAGAGAFLPLTGGTLSGDLVVPADPYDSTGWNGSLEVPTKDAVRDAIEALVAGIPGSYTDEQARDAIGAALVAGTNIAITVNDAGDTITIDATGGGGGTTDLSTEYTSTSPSAPGAGLTIFDRKRAGRHGLSARSPNAMWEVQRALASSHIKWAVPNGSSTIQVMGINSGNFSGSSGSISTSNTLTKLRRHVIQTAGSFVEEKSFNEGSKHFWLTGGFFVAFRFGLESMANSSFQWFVGLNTTAPIGADPSTQTNMVGFGVDAADSNVQFMINDGSGTATKVDLGASFPGKTSAAVYEARLYCAAGGSTVYYSLERLDSAQFTEGSATTDLPVSTTLMGAYCGTRNNITTASSAIALINFYAELDV
jgi:hypothetical protein